MPIALPVNLVALLFALLLDAGLQAVKKRAVKITNKAASFGCRLL